MVRTTANTFPHRIKRIFFWLDNKGKGHTPFPCSVHELFLGRINGFDDLNRTHPVRLTGSNYQEWCRGRYNGCHRFICHLRKGIGILNGSDGCIIRAHSDMVRIMMVILTFLTTTDLPTSTDAAQGRPKTLPGECAGRFAFTK